MSTLLLPGVPENYLQACRQFLQRRHLKTVFEERNVQGLCAFPSCHQRFEMNTAKYRISLKRKSIKDATNETQFCSDSCNKNAHIYVSKLKSTPPQLLPPLQQVFGAAHPNPFTWDSNRIVPKECAPSTGLAPARTKCVWSKSVEAKVLERSVPASPIRIIEKAACENKNIEFPTAAQAVLIEGFVFPAHKEKAAKRLENRLAKSVQEEKVDQGCDTSEESQSDSESSSVCSSDSSDEEADTIVSTEQLSLFSNVWRLFASWTTRQTQEFLVLGKVLSNDESTTDGSDPLRQRTQVERMMAFESILARSICRIPVGNGIFTDISTQKRMSLIVRTLKFPETIDGRDEQQWLCIALIFVTVAQRHNWAEPPLSSLYDAVHAITGLNSAEVDQILGLFQYSESDFPVTEAEALSQSIVIHQDGIQRSDAPSKACRRCRRSVSKCTCHSRKKSVEAEVSIQELDRLMMEAMELRKEQEF
nr:AlNc14C422G11533 [Albugo laibachii Nc14]|eukprot:CCA26850.1 AlNc14C422G11533 [Albugo laibachii Nc14]